MSPEEVRKSRQQRRAEERRSSKNGGAPLGSEENPHRPEVVPQPGPPQMESQTAEQQMPDGVWIIAQYAQQENGKPTVSTSVNLTGNTRPTEVVTLLEMALKQWRKESGLDA